MVIKKILSLLCVMWFVPVWAHCAAPLEKPLDLYKQRVYTSRNGLPQNSIFAITQTADGYIWLATDNGLARFDGVNFDVYSDVEIPALLHNHFHSLLVDRDQVLWIGSWKGGVMRYQKGGFQKMYSAENGLLDGNVQSVIQTADGAYFFATIKGLNRLHNGKLSPVPLTGRAPSRRVQALAQDNDGRLWVGTSDGLLVLPDTGEKAYMRFAGLENHDITALDVDKEGNLWISTNEFGVYRVPAGQEEGEPDLHLDTSSGLSSNIIATLYADPDGSIWMGTRGHGLHRYHNGKVSLFDQSKGLSHDYVTAIFKDREGNLWVGTNGGGVTLLSDSKITVYNTRNILTYDHVFGLYQDRSGNTWVGTFGNGVNCLKDGRLKRHYTTKDGLPEDLVITMTEDLQGDMWFGAYNGGVSRLRNGRFTTYTTKDGLISNIIYGVYCDSKGMIWAGTKKGGLHRFENGKFKLFATIKEKVRTFLEDRNGSLWVGADVTGVVRIENRMVEYFGLEKGLPSQDVMGLFEDMDGGIWVATYGGGMARFNRETRRFQAIKRRNGLPGNILFWILEDDNRQLWVSCMEGIFRVSRLELEQFLEKKIPRVSATLYNEADGLVVREGNGGSQASGLRTQDGRLLFISAEGVAVIDPSAMRRKAPPPPVAIKDITIDGRRMFPWDTLSVPPGKGDMEINYTAFNFTLPERVQFQYKLEGYDERWVAPGQRRTAFYTNIPEGSYRFRVRAANHEGLWNETGAHLDITIAPHFWETWWFQLLAVLTVLFIVRLFYLLKMQSIRRQGEKLKTLVEERTQSLEKKTAELEIRKSDLEKIDNVVKSINAEVAPRDVLSSILNESAVIKGVQRALALVYDKSLESYTFAATTGYDVKDVADVRFTPAEAEDRYIKKAAEVFENIYIIEKVAGRPGQEKFKDIKLPKSMLVLKIAGEGSEPAAGYLIFADMTREDAFKRRDIHLLEKLKSHVASAFIKSKLLLELESEREMAEAANNAKSMFLARMSHEIRTPMNSVIGFADILLHSPLNEEQQEFARNITKSGEALLHLIDEILDFSKIEAGRLTIHPIDFDIEVTAFDVCRSMQPRLDNKPVEILCRIGDAVPAFIHGDAARIRQVLVNLMGNAAKFTREGEIELSVDIQEEKENRFLLHMKVRDTGIGISEDQVEQIFEAFQQADGSVTRQFGGTGLGLAISRQIARLMGGDICVESGPGQGSIFHFTAWLGHSQKEFHEPESPADIELDGRQILLSADSPNHLDILANIMLRAKMQPVTVEKGSQALSLIEDSCRRGEPFDACILDMQMVGLSGWELAGQIRGHKEPCVARIPLLGLSSPGFSREESPNQDVLDGFLPKPIRPRKLTAMLKRLLSAASPAAPAQEAEPSRPAAEGVVTRHSLAEDAKHSVYILLAEDNPLNQKLALFMLNKGGYRVDVVPDGKQAVDTFSAYPDKYQLIFMDINMPEMDGREATRLLREKGFNDIPIVAMTAHALKEDRAKCLDAGMNDYITKPIKREKVFNMIEKWVLY
jgi:signal transduction histidine kinase/ligand-binding sensor domain-containing protein/CheY-like chemotaxis protein